MVNMLLFQILVCTLHGKIQKSHANTINLKYQLQYGKKIDLPNWSYSVSDVQDYFEYILKSTEKRVILVQ